VRDVLDAATVRELLDYEPDTGIFRWRVNRPPRGKAGDVAGWHDHGYIRISIAGRKCYAHCLAWLWMTGQWADEIDHKNRRPADNRWSNLRPATHAANGRNQVLRNTNTSGHVGVYKHKSGVFHSYLMVDGRKHHLGTFPTFEEAKAARLAVQQRHGFSPSHGSKRHRQIHAPLRGARPVEVAP
jgi:hypothetical protein